MKWYVSSLAFVGVSWHGVSDVGGHGAESLGIVGGAIVGSSSSSIPISYSNCAIGGCAGCQYHASSNTA